MADDAVEQLEHRGAEEEPAAGRDRSERATAAQVGEGEEARDDQDDLGGGQEASESSAISDAQSSPALRSVRRAIPVPAADASATRLGAGGRGYLPAW